MAIITEICGYDSNDMPFCRYDFVKVITTDQAHENDSESKFCSRGAYGQVIDTFYNDRRFVLVQFTIIGENGVTRIDVGLLCDNLRIINDE